LTAKPGVELVARAVFSVHFFKPSRLMRVFRYKHPNFLRRDDRGAAQLLPFHRLGFFILFFIP
jgi:hypothetical protein